jgi:hypothetical protein
VKEGWNYFHSEKGVFMSWEKGQEFSCHQADIRAARHDD